MACLFINGADKARYGDMVNGIRNDFVKGIDTFPKTLETAFALLTKTKPTKGGKVVPGGSSFAQGGTIACWGCGKPGVVLSECTNPECVAKWKAKQEKKAMPYRV